MADPKDKPIPDDIPKSPAEAALQMAQLRQRIKELEEQKAPQTQFAQSVGSGHEIHAGSDDDGRDLWHFKIDLPPSGGTEIKVNGIPFFHGLQYKVNTDTLRVLKDIVARTWKHEESIHGSNENFYRRPTERILRGQGR